MSGIEARSVQKKASGAMWVFNPIGSSYVNPKTGETVVRTQSSLQYKKAGSPNATQLDPADLENFRLLLNSKEFPIWLESLPETSELEPNTI